MKKFWKILGLGALAVGLTPYKVEKNEETGENSYQALLWRATSKVDEAGEKQIGVNLGEGALTSKIMGAVGKKHEPHLFSDELSVEYNAPAATEEVTEKAAEVVEEAAEAAENAAETVEEAVVETAEETVEAVEEAVEKIAEPEETQEPQAE
ncbi:MAG: hypothetical protein HDT14_12765 [Oscillibacter sp.]|nr:hypothetical protein [Oscillibacter sp.]